MTLQLSMIDSSLNTELRNGNPKAYEDLYSLTVARLRNYCKLFLKDNILIEDLVQNSYVKLWERRNSIEKDKSVESLMFTIVRNQCLNYLRDQKMLNESFSLDEGIRSDLQHLYQLDFKGIEEKTLEEELFQALKKTIDNLPDRQKEILIKCKIEGKKQKDLADELGISIKTIEKSLAKSKHHLQIELLNQFPTMAIIITMLLK